MYSENFITNDWFNVEVFNKNKYTLTNQENKDVTELWLQILKGLKFPNELKETVSYSKNLKELSLKTHAEVSVCIIAKNEQDSIRKCINSIYEFSDEIIFIDTGSIDLTKKIVKEIASEKVKIFDYTWQDDFSDARNYSIQKASKEWILIIDADEYVSSDELTKLRLLIDMLDRFKFKDSLRVSCAIYQLDNVITHGQSRLFRNNNKIKYYGLIHEELRNNKGLDPIFNVESEITFFHDGYKEILRKEKCERNIRLLAKMLEKEPDNVRWAYLYCRDSFSINANIDFEKILLPFLIKNMDESISYENILLTNYTHLILFLITKKYIIDGKSSLVSKCIKVLEKMLPNSSDVTFYKFLNKQHSLYEQQFEFLKEVIQFRKNNEYDQYSQIGCNLLHYDLLISGLLFDVKSYDYSYQYFLKLDLANYFSELEIPDEYKMLINKYRENES